MSVTRSVLFLIPFALGFGDQPTNMMAAIPLHFEPNLGQMDSRVCFTARSGGMSVFLTPEETVFARSGDKPVRMKLRRSRPARYEAMDRLPGISNYYRGNDPKKWREGVPHYKGVRAKGVYEGVDVVYYGNARRLEYDFVVAQGADPSKIELAYEGTESMRVDRDGDLVLVTKSGELRQRKPVVYQEVGGRRVEVAGSYRIRGGSVGFELARYDASKPVVIDPILEYGTFLEPGGQVWDIAVDNSGAIHFGGTSDLPSFPLGDRFGTIITPRIGLVSKFTSDGSAVAFATYLGEKGSDLVKAIALDPSGNVFITGRASSTFPTRNAIQPTRPGGELDGFAARLDSGGRLVFSTFLGGSRLDDLFAIAVHSRGVAIAGTTVSPDFPKNQMANPIWARGIVTQLALDGSRIEFTAAVPEPTQWDHCTAFRGVAVDPSGSILVTGTAEASYGLGTPGAFQPASGGSRDAVVAKLSSDGSRWLYVTHLGGPGDDFGNAIAIDPAGRAYVTGGTRGGFPLRNAGPTAVSDQAYKAFLTILNPTGSDIALSTLLGGTGDAIGYSVALAPSGDILLSGDARSHDFPLINAWTSTMDVARVFLAKLTSAGALRYSTFFGMRVGESKVVAAPNESAVVFTGFSGLDRYLTPADYATPASAFPTPVAPTYAAIGRFVDGPPPVPMTFTSRPLGRTILIDGRPYVTPVQMSWQPGTPHLIDAVARQVDRRVIYSFHSWSHSGSAAQRLITPSSGGVFEAAYASTPCSYLIVPAFTRIAFESRPLTLEVRTEPGCAWTPSSTGIFSSIYDALERTGPGSFTVIPRLNLGSTRSELLRAGAGTAVIEQRGGDGPLGAPQVSPVGAADAAGNATLQWSRIPGATGYEVYASVRTSDGTGPVSTPVHFQRIDGGDSTRALMHLGRGSFAPYFDYSIFVRACSGAFTDSTCGPYGSRDEFLGLSFPSGDTRILSPADGQVLSSSTNMFTWQPVPQAITYEATLWTWDSNQSRYNRIMEIRTPHTNTIFTAPSSDQYLLSVRPCSQTCSSGSSQSDVRFKIRLPRLDLAPPSGLTARVTNGNTADASWSAVAGADLYRVQVVQPNTGPGGGALTVAAKQISTTNVSLQLPGGAATVVVNACNGDGCGQPATFPINVPGPNPSVPIVATPMPVMVTDGPLVTLSWNRIAGDNGTNTDYRLYVGDLSRDGPALDVITKNNFYGAYLLAGGRRYDAIVFATQNGVTVQGPASGFLVKGEGTPAPGITSPAHNSTFRQGVFRLAWSPMPSTTNRVANRYQYYVARSSQSVPVLTGMTTGLFIDTSLPVTAPTRFQAIVRACISLDPCTLDSDAGWGPWSNTVTGTTTFTITP